MVGSDSKVQDIKNFPPFLGLEKVQKNIIKVSILNYKTETTSNSVESHLSRIRNKLESINSFVKIVSNEKGIISIKYKG